MKRRALIIGGSVAGLFAAHLLRQTDFDVSVFERTTGDLGDRGTGIGTRPELFGVMRRIGVEADAADRIDVAGRTCLDASGDTTLELPTRAVTSAWSRIWQPLRRALPPEVHFGGRTLSRLHADSAGVTAVFADGSEVRGDLLIGADGLHSAVRAAMLPGAAPRYAGYVAWRGAVQAGRLPENLRGLMFQRMVFGFPPGELMLSIPMPSTLGGAQGCACHFVWFRAADEATLAALCTDAAGRSHGLSIPPPLIRPELIEALKTDAAGLLAPQFRALLDACPQIILQPIFDLETPRIGWDRVALIGDAAFVARPHVATGVMKSAIDAESLADALASTADIGAALARYNAERQPYGEALAARGRHIARMIVDRAGDAAERTETVMREYGSAGLVKDRPIAARV